MVSNCLKSVANYQKCFHVLLYVISMYCCKFKKTKTINCFRITELCTIIGLNSRCFKIDDKGNIMKHSKMDYCIADIQ